MKFSDDIKPEDGVNAEKNWINQAELDGVEDENNRITMKLSSASSGSCPED